MSTAEWKGQQGPRRQVMVAVFGIRAEPVLTAHEQSRWSK